MVMIQCLVFAWICVVGPTAALLLQTKGYVRRPLTALRGSSSSSWARADIGDFIVQRAIQTQLYYSADLRNEPQVGWLAKFGGHEHLDTTGRHVGGAGLPHTYTAALGCLNGTTWRGYLDALGTAPEDVVRVELAAPPNRLSSRQQANPFLKAAVQQSIFYDEPVEPRAVLNRLLDTADALIETWTFHLEQLERGDRARVARELEERQGLPSSAMRRDAALERGGETVYARGGEPMPFAANDRAAVDRLVTLRAFDALLEELSSEQHTGLLLEYYLEADEELASYQGAVDERVVERQSRRKARGVSAPVEGDDETIAIAAREAALEFARLFAQRWMPRLERGDDDSMLLKNSVARPGLKKPRREIEDGCGGADAPEVLEALWAEKNAPSSIRGSELISPRRLGVRLRELRAECARQARKELKSEVGKGLQEARANYPQVAKPLGSTTQSLQQMYRGREDLNTDAPP